MRISNISSDSGRRAPRPSPVVPCAMQALSDKLAWYAALTGISMLMLIARLLQLMDFQVGN